MKTTEKKKTLFRKPRSTCLWFAYKDSTRPKGRQWVHKSTGTENEAQARKLMEAFLAQHAAQTAGDAPNGPQLTLRQYVGRWLKEREDRGIGATASERRMLERYVLPKLGSLPIDGMRPRHVRDLVRGLKALKKTVEDESGEKQQVRALAPRSVLHIFRTLHNVYEGAIVDELVIGNPVKVKRGELPKKVDADPEWRSKATYTVREVERLFSDTAIPVERRVQYALKAIAGLRHGEVAALCWRHLDYTAEPLARINIVQSWDSVKREIKSTKTEETRAVPMHPTLAKVLAAWKLEHWERIYGRKPTDDDFVVPTRTFSCVNVADAGHAMTDDLEALGLRVKAGKTRKRGGHDLRSWFLTRCIEDGADSAIVRSFTHAADKSVNGGYERWSWAAKCRELSKLTVTVLDGAVLHLVQAHVQAEKRARNRWRSREVTP